VTAAPVPVAVAGATGRMGGEVARAIEAARDLALVARPGRADLDGDWAGARVLADFSAPAATRRLSELAPERGVALLVGTTGLDGAAQAALDRAAARVPVLVAPNLSPGVAALTRGLRAVLAMLPGYDVEIVERHHARKLDSPSGTALGLAREVALARGLTLPEALRHGRHGAAGPRSPGEIGVHAVRAGGIVGQHTVLLAGEAEQLELTHVAHSRDCFVNGALVAIRFLARSKPGRYTLEDALA
jgi:4-hydroxy-tetrahydrodipicolinate reductase